MIKTPEVAKSWDILQNSGPVLLKNVRVTRKKGSLRNCDSQEETRRHDSEMCCGALEGILGQDTGIGKQLRKSE